MRLYFPNRFNSFHDYYISYLLLLFFEANRKKLTIDLAGYYLADENQILSPLTFLVTLFDSNCTSTT